MHLITHFLPVNEKCELKLTNSVEHSRKPKEETLDNLRLASQDMLAKLPKDCTIHSQPFSLESTGGPTWVEIRTVFESSLADTPNVKWIFWRGSKGPKSQEHEIPMLKLGSESLNQTQIDEASEWKENTNLCTKLQEKKTLHSVESSRDSSVDDVFNNLQSGAEQGSISSFSSPDVAQEQQQMAPCCKNELYNVRNSVDLSRGKSLKKGNNHGENQVRFQCGWFPTFHREKGENWLEVCLKAEKNFVEVSAFLFNWFDHS